MSHILDILGFYYRMPPMLTIDSEISGLFKNAHFFCHFRVISDRLNFKAIILVVKYVGDKNDDISSAI